MDQLSLDVIVTRGALVESRHRVHAAVVNASGTLIAAARDPSIVTHWRSCAKPFQIMPLIESGGFDSLALGRRPARARLRLARRRAGARRDRRGDALVHRHGGGRPRLRSARAARRSAARRCCATPAARPTRLHNNCSGKHAAMLARAHTAGWSVVRLRAARSSGAAGLPRGGLALDRRPERRRSGWRSTAAASSCSCSALAADGARLRASRRRVAPLGGDPVAHRARHADAPLPRRRHRSVRLRAHRGDRGPRASPRSAPKGVHCVAIVDEGIGIAIKVEDGAQRAQFPAVISRAAAVRRASARAAAAPRRVPPSSAAQHARRDRRGGSPAR